MVALKAAPGTAPKKNTLEQDKPQRIYGRPSRFLKMVGKRAVKVNKKA